MIFFDAGGGHRSAATALLAVIAERYPDWRVELVNLQEILEPVDLFHKMTGHQSQSFYNGILKRGWTYGSLTMLRGLQRGISLYSDHIEAVLEERWRRTTPDLLVSLIPNFNGVMYRSFRRVHPAVPYVTVMTDLADCPPHFWQEKQDQLVVCGTDMAVRQAETMGYAADRIFRASGMILRPGFYQPPTGERGAGRVKLGLNPDLPTGLVMFGGYGSTTALKIVEKLEKSELDVQVIVMCGHNEKLREKLENQPNCLAVGFTDRVADYMHLSDFFIGKPGPGSISEALQMGLPAIIECNRKTMPQERYNATWLEEQKLGVVLRDFKDIAAAVRHLLDDGRLKMFRDNARQLNNRAVFEIPDMFAKMMRA